MLNEIVTKEKPYWPVSASSILLLNWRRNRVTHAHLIWQVVQSLRLMSSWYVCLIFPVELVTNFILRHIVTSISS